MNHIKKAALLCSILFCINYALDQLLGFDAITALFTNRYWLHKFTAFIIGAVGFINILLFQHED